MNRTQTFALLLAALVADARPRRLRQRRRHDRDGTESSTERNRSAERRRKTEPAAADEREAEQGPDDRRQATANRSAASPSSNYSAGEQSASRSDSDDSGRDPRPRLRHDEGRRQAGGTVNSTSRPKSKAIFEAELEGRKEQIARAAGQPVSLPAVRARAGRQAGPADPGLAVRLGGVDRPDRLLLRALGGLARAPLRGASTGGRSGRGSRARLLGLPAQVLCGAIGVFLLGVAVYAGLRGTEAPDRNFALTFLFVTCWLGFPFFSAIFGDLFRPFNPWRAIGRAVGGGFRAIAGQRARPPRLSRAARPLAGGDRPARRRLARGRLRRQRRRRGRSRPARGRRRRPRLQRLHAGDDGRCSGSRSGASAARSSRSTSGCSPGSASSAAADGRLGAPPAALRRDHLGDDPRLGRGRDRLDRHAPASTAPRRARSRTAIESIFELARRHRPRPHHRRCASPTRSSCSLCFAGVGLVYLLGVRGMRTVRGAPSLREAAHRLRPHPDPDRPRLPRRPLLQPLRLPGAGPVHLPALRPARHRRPPTSSAPPPAGIDFTRPQRQRDLVRPGRRPRRRPRPRPHPRPRPRPRLLAATTARPPAPSTGCWR